ncbi:hypothetical protein GCM10010358_76830 [Streptomyces minutiscleroticus]|uniref:Uncharacterized protein n=1 Tax=Streptomyces minutiscleroticus TaxID=68238 RepID=A0A918P1F8_9ACTN|nr:hypothetical protein GCM10010358_76830 [Streptomyces minutiscleroticus]
MMACAGGAVIRVAVTAAPVVKAAAALTCMRLRMRAFPFVRRRSSRRQARAEEQPPGRSVRSSILDSVVLRPASSVYRAHLGNRSAVYRRWSGRRARRGCQGRAAGSGDYIAWQMKAVARDVDGEVDRRCPGGWRAAAGHL